MLNLKKLYLKLNEPGEKFKEFDGRNIDQMPKLLGKNRTPLSSAGLMERRLEVLTASEDVKVTWWGNYFGTGDAMIYHPDGRFKVVTGNNAEPVWKELNPKSPLKHGALILPEGTYDKLDGESFTREEIRRYGIAEKLLNMEEAKRNPIWKALAGGNQALLDSYVDTLFKKAKEDFNYNGDLMGIWLSQPKDITTGRLWFVGSVYGNSSANGNYNLGNDDSRLIGIAPKTP